MIQFFRKIRHSLVSENKFRKYLLYAIGEIILVVIGILIALQINNWNDYRKERQSEQLILRNFKKNLKTDAQLLQQFHESADKGIKAVDTILLMVNSHIDFNYMSFATSIERVLSNNYFQTTSTTFDQSISTGNIDLIQDDSLRFEILNYYKLSKLNFEDNRMLETNQNHVFPTLFSLIIPTKSVSYSLTGIETTLPELDLGELATNQAFNTWVIFKKSAFQRQAENYSYMGDNVNTLIGMIDSQLKKE